MRAGSVLRMILKNFMCHSHLEVTFNSNINYVIGRNGSGKSAILTALVVGLGGKATLTNRGNSVKGERYCCRYFKNTWFFCWQVLLKQAKIRQVLK